MTMVAQDGPPRFAIAESSTASARFATVPTPVRRPFSPEPSIKGKGRAVDYGDSGSAKPLAAIKKAGGNDGVRFADILERDRWMVGDGPRPRYRLKIRQHPERARLCSYKEENDTIDRRPIDPPIVVEVCTDESDPSELLEACNLFIRATIVHPDAPPTHPAEFDLVKTPTGADATAGEVVQTPEKLRGLNGAFGAYCIFAKVGARIPGVFRVKTTLYETSLNGVAEVASAVSDKFEVFSPKLFTGMLESTPLTRHFAAQGLKIKLRPQKQQTEARQRGKLATSAVKKSSSRGKPLGSRAESGRVLSSAPLSAASSFEMTSTPATSYAVSPSVTPGPSSGWARGWNSSWDHHAEREDGWGTRPQGKRPTGDDGTFMPWDSMPIPTSEWKGESQIGTSPPPLFYPPAPAHPRAASGGFPAIDLSRFSLSASNSPLPRTNSTDMDTMLRRTGNPTHNSNSLAPIIPSGAFSRHPGSTSASSAFSLQNRTSATRSEPRGGRDSSKAMYRDDGLPTSFGRGNGITLQDMDVDDDGPTVPLKRPTRPSLSSLLQAEDHCTSVE